METGEGKEPVLGIDFGTDECRAVLVDARDGTELGQASAAYRRWAEGRYCDPARGRFRQHPLDHVEALEAAAARLRATVGAALLAKVRAVAVDATASTPCAVDGRGRPLALQPAFAEDPDAMFVLWKDHEAVAEAAEITAAAKSWGGRDFTEYEGGTYSAEWFWAKALRVLRSGGPAAEAAVSFLEHGDWAAALLCGTEGLSGIRRGRCAAGHKAMWHADFGGYPDDAFLALLHPRLAAVKATLGTETWTADKAAGRLCPDWAGRLGLMPGIPVAVASIDAHAGAVGSGAGPGVLVKVMGTSTCDIVAAPLPAGKERLVRGICGQVDGSVVPGMLGYEAGQSAFGDVYAWFRGFLLWPVARALRGSASVGEAERERIEDALRSTLLGVLSEEASRVDPEASSELALDWLNGRRTPDADQGLRGAIAGIGLGTTPPLVFRALVEATAFGSRAIAERLREEGVAVDRVVAVGGVARKSPFVVQVVSDAMGLPVEVPDRDQAVALGAAMYASVVAGLHPDVGAAQRAMKPAAGRTYVPDPVRAAAYARRYAAYRRLGSFLEAEARR